MKCVVWWKAIGDDSEYTFPIAAADLQAAETKALRALQAAVEDGDWMEADGHKHGTVVEVLWSVRPKGAARNGWDNRDWFVIPPDETGLLRALRRQYQHEGLAHKFRFCGLLPYDHDWCGDQSEQVCTRCGIVRREKRCEFQEPSYVEFVQVYYDLPQREWLEEHLTGDE